MRFRCLRGAGGSLFRILGVALVLAWGADRAMAAEVGGGVRRTRAFGRLALELDEATSSAIAKWVHDAQSEPFPVFLAALYVLL